MIPPRIPLVAVVLLVFPALLTAQNPAPPTLEELTVTVGRTPVLLGAAGFSVTIIDALQARRGRTFPSLDDVLGFVPGLMVRDRGDQALGPRLMIRGAGARANFGVRGLQLLVDGVPATLADGQSPLTTLDLELAERVEVVRGPLASLHGNGAQGIVSLSTAARPTTPWQGRFAASGGSRGTSNLSALAGAGNQRLGGFVAASRFNTDGVRDHAGARQWRLRGALEWTLSPRSRVTLRGSYADDPWLDAPGALTATEFAADPRGANPAAVLRGAGKSVQQGQVSLGYRHRGDRHTTDVTAWTLGRELLNPLALRPATATDPRDGTLIEIARAVTGVRATTTRRLRGALLLTAGLDAQRQDDDRHNSVHRAATPLPNSRFLDQQQVVTGVGPFVQLVALPHPGVTLRGGIRHDRVTFDITDRLAPTGSGRRTMAAWSGSAAIALATATFEGWASVGTAFETPTTTELAGRTDGRTGINDLLDPARSRSVEVGLRHRAGGREAEVVAWHTMTRDAITPIEEVDGRSYFANVGRTTSRGVEATLSSAVGRRWRVRATGSYLEARFGAGAIAEDLSPLEGNRLPGIPRLTARLGLTGSVAGVLVDLDHGVSSALTADDGNTVTVPGWAGGITNAALRWPATRAVTAFGSVHNLFDRAYAASVVVNGFGGRVIEPGSGRLLTLGVEIRLAPLP